jgi:hypothetical protein
MHICKMSGEVAEVCSKIFVRDHLLICSIFNYALSVIDYKASNERVISE